MSLDLAEATHSFLRVAAVLVALTQCFAGFRLIRFWAAFGGFVIGFVSGWRAASLLDLPADTSLPLPLLLAAGAGLVLSLLSYRLFKMGVFLFCGALAAQAAGSVLGSREAANALPPALLHALQAAAFALAGYLGARFMRTAIILLTGAAGAWVAVRGIYMLAPAVFSEAPGVLTVFLILAAAGIFVQFMTTHE